MSGDGGSGSGSSGAKLPAPSTEWKEQIGEGEEARHAALASRFIELQKRKSQQHGEGRALHRKDVLALRGRLTVRDRLPEHLAHGLFAKPGPDGGYEAWIRLSNGSADRQPDRRPDVRGFGLQVRGVSGDGALGSPTTVQEFAMIHFETFTFASSEAFAGVVLAASDGPIALLKHLIKQHGFFAGLREAGRLQASFGQPFRGFAVEPFFSAAPIACGPYAVKVRLLPATQPSATDEKSAKEGWKAAMGRHLAAGPLRYQLQLQAFVNERDTPIEDPRVRWLEEIAPFVTVADLEIPTQPIEGADVASFANDVEHSTFDPWAAHRPLGEVMRARKATYFESQKGRGAQWP